MASSPVGNLRVSASARGVTAIHRGSGTGAGTGSMVVLCEQQLKQYFEGRLQTFTVPLDLAGTPFQKRVWVALRSVPFGTTLTYGELAKKIGKPRAVRAVASAVARNPVGVIIPCHRVVPASGPLPGKFAWGEDKKRWLLEHETREKR